MTLLETSTAEGAQGGMVLSQAAHELKPSEVAWLQDALINQQGMIIRRGAIQGTTSLGNNLDAQRPLAVATMFDPAGVQKVAVFYLLNGATNTEVWAAIYSSSLVFIQKHLVFASNVPNAQGKNITVTTCPGIDGSTLISIRYGIDNTPTFFTATMKWYGACPTLSTFGAAATLTETLNSTTVTGTAAEIAKVSFPGLCLDGLGVVQAVVSTTSITLRNPSPLASGSPAVAFSPFQFLSVARSRGRVSFSGAAAASPVGYGTKWTENNELCTVGGGGNGYILLKGSDLSRVATYNSLLAIDSISDTLLGAASTGAQALALQEYLLFENAITPYGLYPGRDSGAVRVGLPRYPKAAQGSFFTAYKGLNLSFNARVSAPPAGGGQAGDTNVTGRMYVHGPRFPEIMDHTSADGNWADVASTVGGDPHGMALIGGSDCVVLCKRQESFALTGDDPDNFVINKIADDGALSPESVTTYKGVPIWVGKTGVWMYTPGMGQPENLVAHSLGTKWGDYMVPFDYTSTALDAQGEKLNQARCFVYRDFLFINVTNTAAPGIYTDGVQRAQIPLYLMIYMPTRALTVLSNFNFQGFFVMGQRGYVVLPQNGSTTHHFFPVDNLLQAPSGTVSDAILTSNSYNSGTLSTSVGPWFHLESRKYSLGDGLRRKTWKQLSLEYFMTNTKRVFLETVPGLNTTGTRQPIPYVGTGLFKAFKNKFNARDQYMSFRLYEDIANRPGDFQLGAWQWAFKLARRGQV